MQRMRVWINMQPICGADIKPVPIEWLWDTWLALGKLHVIAGLPGTGKTTIGLALAASLTSGGRWPDGSSAPVGNVLIWSGEDDPTDTLAPRLIGMGADMSRVHFVGAVKDGQGELSFDPSKHMKPLENAIARTGGIDLLIILNSSVSHPER
jgi:putative DNA primase/helicase